MSDARPPAATVLVWDLPTRLFHWTLVLLVAIAWATGDGKGLLFVVHTLAGWGILVALLFRLAWGVIGGRHSRFGDFVRRWPAVRDHARGLLALRSPATLGHNPIGGWMILALLAVLAATVATGLFAADDDIGGPWAAALPAAVAHAVAEVHEGLFNLLLVLIGIHVGGVVLDSLLTGHNLVRAMIDGRKPVAAAVAATVSGWRAVVTVAAAIAVVWLLATL
ncbi:MAG: cytochrome b/b6 domain-containing protein [Rhodospirillales bacterium]